LESVTGFVLMADYDGALNSIDQVPVAEVSKRLESANGVQLVDVRQPGEYAAGHAYRARNLPLNSLEKSVDQLDPSVPTYVICQTGYRSSLATSLLENAGFKSLYNVAGGTSAWMEAGLDSEKESTACAA